MKKLIALVLAVIMIIGLVACGGGGVVNSAPTPDGSGTQSNGQSYSWRLASAWGAGSPQFAYDQRFCDRVAEMSGGRLIITPYGSGQLAATTEVFDLTASGDVEVGSDAPQYWSGKNTAFDLLGYNVMGLNTVDYTTWVYGGGYEVARELYGQYGLVYYYTAITNAESGIRSNAPITSLSDLDGKNIRMSGLVIGKVLGKLGITSTSMSLDEALDGITKGVIDALEYSAPAFDYSMQVHEICKYWTGPGFHQTTAPYGVFFNQSAWDSLDDELKLILSECAKSNYLEAFSETLYNDGMAAEMMVNEGVTISYLPDEDMSAIEQARNEVYEEMAAENAEFAKIAKSQMDYFKSMTYYQNDFLGDYSTTRIPQSYPDLG